MYLSWHKTHDNDGTPSTASGKVECYNKAIVASLRHYVAVYQRDWDLFVQPLNYGYKIKIYWSTNTTSFNLVLAMHPSAAVTFDIPSALTTDVNRETDTQALQTQLLASITELWTRFKKRLDSAEEPYRNDYDTKVSSTPTFFSLAK